MSSQTPFNELLKIAVLGLQNSADFRPALPRDVAAVVATKHYPNPAQCFLDAAALTSLQAELSRVPAADSFDELPDIPQEKLRALNPVQQRWVQQVFNQPYLAPGSSALRLLQRGGYALPDRLFCDLMEAEKLEKHAAVILRAVASARARWLSEMNPRWRDVLGMTAQPTPFHQARSTEQLWHLAQLDSGAISEFCLAQWPQCNANGRRLLLAYLRSYPPQASGQWLAQHRHDKSAPIKRELLRWFMTCSHPEAQALQQKAAAQLSVYLDSSKPAEADLNVPETLSEALGELAIVDQDYLGSEVAKPIQRLAQLLVLTGPQMWAQQLQCDSGEAMARLLKTRFAEELRPYLLEAALYHQDSAALTRWCEKTPLKERSRLPDFFSSILFQLGPRHSLHWVESILRQGQIALLLSVKTWQRLVDFNCLLPSDTALNFFEQWCQHIVKHRYVFDREVACTLPLWLDLNAAHILQNQHWRALREKQKFPSNNLDMFETLFQLKTQLQNHREVTP